MLTRYYYGDTNFFYVISVSTVEFGCRKVMFFMVGFLQDAHHSFIDGREIIVDYNRQQLMPGWIPRRLGECHSLTLPLGLKS